MKRKLASDIPMQELYENTLLDAEMLQNQYDESVHLQLFEKQKQKDALKLYKSKNPQMHIWAEENK